MPAADDLDTLRRRHAALCEEINDYDGSPADSWLFSARSERNRLYARIEELEEREREADADED